MPVRKSFGSAGPLGKVHTGWLCTPHQLAVFADNQAAGSSQLAMHMCRRSCVIKIDNDAWVTVRWDML